MAWPEEARTWELGPQGTAQQDVGAAEPDRGGGGGSVPAEQVRPGVPQALPRQRDRYVSFTVGEFNFQFYFESIAASCFQGWSVVGWD